MAASFIRTSNEYFTINGLPTILNGTITFRIKSSSTNVGQAIIAADLTQGATSYNISSVGGNSISVIADESCGHQVVTSGSGIVFEMAVRDGTDFYCDGTWHSFAYRVDGVDNAMFIDGVKKTVHFQTGNATTPNVFFPHTTFANIARSTWGTSNTINGQLDDLRIYDEGKTDAECVSITGGQGNDKIVNGLQGWWRFQGGPTGTNIITAIDISGQGLDGVGVNTPIYIESPLKVI